MRLKFHVPDSYIPSPVEDSRKKKRVSVDFGDAFFVDTFLHSSGLMDVVDCIGYGNPDTLHAMLLFYTLSGLANCDAIHWYEGNIVRLLYPDEKNLLSTIESIRGCTRDCFENCPEKGVIVVENVHGKNTIEGNPKLNEAYLMGKNC